MVSKNKPKGSIGARVAPVWKSANSTEKEDKTNYRFPSKRSSFLSEFIDYSEPSNLREVLNKWHSMRCLTHPTFALELLSLFLRCLHATFARCRNNLSSIKSFICGAVASLGWIYANGCNAQLPNSLSEKSLQLLLDNDKELFEVSMEPVQLCLASTWQRLRILPGDVFRLDIGRWLDETRNRACNGISGDFLATGKLPIPIYVFLRAIDPNCPCIHHLPCNGVSFKEVVCVELMEPKIYEPAEPGDYQIRFPPATEDGRDYNLWYFYDCMKPEPY